MSTDIRQHMPRITFAPERIDPHAPFMVMEPAPALIVMISKDGSYSVVPNEVSLITKILWRHSKPGDYVCGMKFADPEGYYALSPTEMLKECAEKALFIRPEKSNMEHVYPLDAATQFLDSVVKQNLDKSIIEQIKLSKKIMTEWVKTCVWRVEDGKIVRPKAKPLLEREGQQEFMTYYIIQDGENFKGIDEVFSVDEDEAIILDGVTGLEIEAGAGGGSVFAYNNAEVTICDDVRVFSYVPEDLLI